MVEKERINFSKITVSLILILGIILVAIAVFFYQRRSCLSVDFSMCITSKKFVSKTINLSFRYPEFFPLSKPDEEWEIKQAKDFGNLEELDFSKEFFFNAGGDRLGFIIVEKKSDITNIEDYERYLLEPKTIFSSKMGKEVIIPPPTVKRVRIGNNIEALSISESDALSLLSRNSAEYVIFKNGLKYQVAFKYDDYHHKLPKEKYFKGFDLILSTLEI